MFMLIEPRTVTLLHINVRTEKHGPNDIDAFDLDFALKVENRPMLDMLQPGLCDALYYCAADDDGQARIDGVPETVPNLRFPKLPDAIAWDTEASGVDLKIIYGLGDDASNIDLEDGKAVMKKFEAEEGGTVTLFFRYAVAGYPDGVIDKLRKKLKQELTLTMVRPERLRQEAIDGTVGHPGAADAGERDATDLFAAGGGAQPGPDDADSEGGETEAAAASA